MWAQQEQRSPSRIVSRAGSLKSPGKRGGVDFSPRPHQRACQVPLTRQGGDALTLEQSLDLEKLHGLMEFLPNYKAAMSLIRVEIS
jgi:hypothetical protein